MQVTAGGGEGGGLTRFRSAPATWLDALLEDDDSLKLEGPHQGGLTQLLTAGTTTTTAAADGPSGPDSSAYIQQAGDPGVFDCGRGVQTNAGFYRMNSSPADFLSGNVDGYFSTVGNLDFGGSSADVSVSSSGKRLMDFDYDHPSSSFANHRANGLLDMEMEKMLDDSVPRRVRAKRGFATHPRSIAERVRRTRISDRIRKLQELVPNMDKQTNTADMLEEAVEYVKTLQKQIQELTEQQEKCTCTAKG